MTHDPFPTAAYVELHARRRPASHAVIGSGNAISYATMAQQLRCVTAELAGLGLAQGSLVALGHEDEYLELLLLLGFESLGVVVEMVSPGRNAAKALPAAVALVVTSDSFPVGTPHRVLRIDPAWWGAVLDRVPAAAIVRRASGADLSLILHSSGTTGRPKRIPATRGVLDQRIRRRARIIGLTRASRCFVGLRLGVAGQYYSVVACLRLGASIVLAARVGLAQALLDQRATHVTLLPFQVEALLGTLAAGAAPSAALTLCVIGGALPAPVRQAARDRFCGRVISVYSTNEAGSIGIVEPDGHVAAFPEIELRIVAEDGRDLPPGEAGSVLVRGTGLVPGYAGQGVAVEQPFVDGWFAPGDLGIRLPDGGVRLLGRADDLVNLGGIKVACADIEERVLRTLPVRETAVFMREDDRSGQTLMVCVVPPAAFDVHAAGRALQTVLPGRFALHLLDAIPRTPEGKVRRRMLREQLGR